jgi:hypothetical protein
MSYTPPPISYIGSAPHHAVSAKLEKRGITEASPGYREAYIAEADAGYVDPLSRPVREPTPWETRRARDNLVAQRAHDNLAREHGRYSAEQYRHEIARLERQVGHTYKDDAPRDRKATR